MKSHWSPRCGLVINCCLQLNSFLALLWRQARIEHIYGKSLVCHLVALFQPRIPFLITLFGFEKFTMLRMCQHFLLELVEMLLGKAACLIHELFQLLTLLRLTLSTCFLSCLNRCCLCIEVLANLGPMIHYIIG